MNEDFAPFELAVKLKEKGYPQDAFIGYDEFGTLCIGDGHSIVCASPIISQVLKWLREEKGMEVYSNYNRVYKHWTYIARAFDDSCYNSVGGFKSYEQAALAGIEYVLDNLI